MADSVDRYATNSFTNFSNFEKGVFNAGQEQAILAGDNPAFIWPPKTLRNAPVGSTQKVQRGYMRMLSQGFKDASNLSKRRLHFQFNPDNIVRAVTARNDIQFWMNQDPVQMTQAIPGDANFAFELLFNREAEVTSGMYRTAGGGLHSSTAKANLPLGNAGVGANGKPLSTSGFVGNNAVTDIGVLADLIVFDELIGQGVNTQLIDAVIANTKKITNAKRTSAINAAQGSSPTTTAQAEVTEVVAGKITKVKVNNGGSGYTTAPIITLSGGGGDGTGGLTAVIAKGKITEITITEGGSGYTDAKKGDIVLKFVGGGGGANSTSTNSTSDTQDQTPAQFDEKSAAAAMYANYGNSAFLVSLPVRIVFSSLFMVEGFITSTQVTFNKFNANMVPTQCMVGVTMQAMYIGFAREKTYLTTQLETALNTADTGGEGTVSQSTTLEIGKITSLSEKLFKTLFRGSTSSYFSSGPKGDGNVSPEAVLGGDGIKRVLLGFRSSDELRAALQGRTAITEITQDLTLTYTYRGNSNPSIPHGPAGKNSWADGDSWTVSARGPGFKLTDLDNTKSSPDDTMAIEVKYTDEDTKSGANPLDDSNTSLWDTEVLITFNITTSTGTTVTALQRVSGKQYKKNWADDIDMVDFCVLRLASNPTEHLPGGKIIK